MTHNEFLSALADIKDAYNWVQRGTYIRGYHKDGGFPICPICAVCRETKFKVFSSLQWVGAALILGLDEPAAIVGAADGERGELRDRLTEVLFS